VVYIKLTERQKKIVQIVKEHGLITGENIAKSLGLTRTALRTDFSILTSKKILSAKPKKGYSYLGKGIEDSKPIKDFKVSSYMRKPFILAEETSIYDAIIGMSLDDSSSIFITQNGYLSGVASRKDLLKYSVTGRDLNKMPIGVIMTRMPNIIYCYKGDNIFGIAKKLLAHEIDSIPVVEDEKDSEGVTRQKIVGKLSKTSVTKLFVDLIEDGF
jgi:CBS domain-containing protein/biotin operon repressor